MKNKLLQLKSHLYDFKENQFLTDLNVVLESNISEITIETALMALDILDSILLNKLSLKKLTARWNIKPKFLNFTSP